MSSVSRPNETAPCTALFENIQQIARQERIRMFGPEPEPVEIQMLRLQVAQEAQQMLLDALEQADPIREEARQAGYQTGYTEGYEAGRAAAQAERDAERAQYRAEIEAFVARIEEERQRIWRDVEPQVLDLVLDVARKVIADEAQVNRDIVLSVLRHALRRVTSTEQLRIRVHREDLETVRASREDLKALIDDVPHLEIIEDRRVSPGGCVIETNSGAIDARIETQFSAIEAALRTPVDKTRV